MVKKKNSMVGAVAVPVKRRGLWKTIWRYKWLYLMLVPVIAYYAIFKYAPMYGIVMAFQKYNVFKGVFGSEFIGLDVFKKIFAKTNFWKAIRNTISLNFAFQCRLIFLHQFSLRHLKPYLYHLDVQD